MAVGAKELELLRVFADMMGRGRSHLPMNWTLVIEFECKDVFVIDAPFAPTPKLLDETRPGSPIFLFIFADSWIHKLLLDACFDGMAVRTQEMEVLRMLDRSEGIRGSLPHSEYRA